MNISVGSTKFVLPNGIKIVNCSTIILTNKFDMSIIQTPSVASIKLEPDDDSVIVSPDYDDEICVVLIFWIHHHFHLEIHLPLPQNSV
jgi:hypothetical protein